LEVGRNQRRQTGLNCAGAGEDVRHVNAARMVVMIKWRVGE